MYAQEAFLLSFCIPRLKGLLALFLVFGFLETSFFGVF